MKEQDGFQYDDEVGGEAVNTGMREPEKPMSYLAEWSAPPPDYMKEAKKKVRATTRRFDKTKVK